MKARACPVAFGLIALAVLLGSGGVLLQRIARGRGSGDPFVVAIPETRRILISDFPMDSRIPMAVIVANNSESPISLNVSSKTCGCLEVTSHRGSLLPGDSARLTASLPLVLGRHAQSFVLQIRDSHGPRAEKVVPLNYDVYPNCEVSSDRLLSDWQAGDTTVVKVRFSRYSRTRDRTESGRLVVEQLPPVLRVARVDDLPTESIDSDITKQNWEISLAQNTIGEIRDARSGFLKILLDGEPMISVPYEIVPAEPFLVSPRTLFFGGVRVGDTSVRHCVLRVRGGKVSKAVRFDCGVQAFRARFPGSDEHRRGELAIDVLFTPTHVGVQNATVKILSDERGWPSPVIGVSGLGVTGENP